VVHQVLETMRKHIHGMVHCSGGGQTKVLHFVDRIHVIKDNLLPVPPLFELIQKQSGTSWSEMYQVFNMGHRMEFYVPDQQTAREIIAIAKGFRIEAQVIGRCETASSKQLTISGPMGNFTY
jgi:phosphoribosylformylglycinamidine cyclo-ligase